MADNSGEGCAFLLLMGGLLLTLIYWKIVLSLLLLLGIGAGLFTLAQALRLARLRSIAAMARRRFVGDVCRLDEHFSLVEAIESDGEPRQAHLLLHVATIEPRDGQLTLVRSVLRLTPPADLRRIASNLGFAQFLEGEGITMVPDLAVEAKATQAAITCLRETEWARGSLQTIAQLIGTTRDTLAKARGNELLEPAIPQLEEALAAFSREEEKLASHHRDALVMLGKLHDFLGVPETLRPILNFDLDGLFDPARRRDLETSFQEVVNLNQAFGELSRDRLA